MFRTIKSKFIFLATVFIFLSIVIPVTFLLFQFTKNFEQRSIVMLETTLDILRYGLDEEMSRGGDKNVQEVVVRLSQNKNIQHIRIIDTSGVVIYSSLNDDRGQRLETLSPHHLKGKLKDLKVREVRLVGEKEVYAAFEPILNEIQCQHCHGKGEIIAYVDIDTDLTTAENSFYTGSLHMIFLGILLILILVSGFYYLFNKFINNPLKNFRMALESVEKGKLNIKLAQEGEDEFSILNKHFNSMVSHLKQSNEEIEELHFEQLQRADKLVTIGELTAEMAHEINNHAAIAMSRTDYLQFESGENLNLNPYSEDLRVILNQLTNISRTTSNILKHSKKLSDTFERVDLRKLVNESVKIFEPILRKRNIKLLQNSDAEDPVLYGSPTLLEQALINLINNAVDAVDEKGSIEVSVGENSDGLLELRVWDSGRGIPQEDLDKIFSPFFTRKSAEKGTGLGLYIVRNICTKHKAEIRCQSSPGSGTTFILTFNREARDAE